MATLMPALARRMAAARPIPVAEPVISAQEGEFKINHIQRLADRWKRKV